jgi:type IV pilus assembly protein PilE
MVEQLSMIVVLAARPMCWRARAFTLVELIVVIALIATLTAIAYPAYVSQVMKGNRAAAQQFMLDIANAQAQYQIDARAYSAAIGTGGLGLAPSSSVLTNYAFSVALNAGPPPGYVITATPAGRQAPDGVLTLDSIGNKTPAGKW